MLGFKIKRQTKQQKKPEKALPEDQAKLKQWQEGVVRLKDILAPAAFSVSTKYVEIDGKFATTLFVTAYPRYLETNWLSPIVNFDVEFDMGMFVYPQDSATILRQLKKQITQVSASIIMRTEKGKVRDPQLETAYRDIEELRDRLVQGTERFFQLSLYLTLYADSQEELEETVGQIEVLLEGRLVYIKPAIFQMKEGFFSTIPLGQDKLARTTNMSSSSLSTTFPFVSSDLSSSNGILFGINLHNNSLILFDRFSLGNANMVIFAKSGAGKSYAVKLEILRQLMFDTEVIVIDPEKEYRYLSDSVGGAYLRIATASDHRINPFDLPELGEEDEPETVLRENITRLIGLVSLMAGGFSPEENSVVDKALWETYALKDITKGIRWTKPEVPTLQDFYNIVGDMEGGANIALRIERFVEGTFAGVFNRPTNIDLDNQLVVFNVRDMEEELRPLAMYVVLGFIWNKVRSSLKKRILVVDEAWVMMQHEESAKFMFSIAKRARKYYLGVTTITQDIQDFLDSKYGKPIVTNSSLQLLLRQSPAAIDLLADVFYLTDHEKFRLLESDVGEGILFAGLKHVAIKVVASYAEDQVITSDPQQVLAIEAAKREMAAN
ncbi:MAG TPA: conjugal transfer protein TraC [Candidatus Andersenbacteria bacterium]|nr:MAG: Type IV secretory pathway VirB4 component-like protein [Parcubacteria group bacterium GW2011_GWA2_45_14]OGY35749.1 MAG: conjugal transfer protein TraC [Candidatus Andersenbacteria bacterium RIFCSPHIGHO2_02_FULL_46_16]OGY37480.1 MAG: conjugal transfer protein TraC [Candidatus Andersenbacteria bacterium RIFCSPLOWO2_02_FULL_46_11]HBE90152.1 conjugal transfer protein TraC [Candidatus Andersenbacteria bacterium]